MVDEVRSGLYQKHRPTELSAVVGQSAAVAILEGFFRGATFPRAILMTGPSGTGKTTCGRILARRLGCDIEAGDLIEQNCACLRGIDSVRDIEQRMNYRPIGRSRVWLLDEVHAFTADAQNALLKLLEEERPRHVHFILCTTDPPKLKETVRTRCSDVRFSRVGVVELSQLVTDVALAEQRPVSDRLAVRIAQCADGSPRKALVLLEAAIGIDGDDDDRMRAVEQADVRTQGIELARLLLRGGSWKEVAATLRNLEGDPEAVRQLVFSYANSVLTSERPSPWPVLNRAFQMIRVFENGFDRSRAAGLAAACWELCAPPPPASSSRGV